MITTPVPASAPYTAVETASLRTVTLSISASLKLAKMFAVVVFDVRSPWATLTPSII